MKTALITGASGGIGLELARIHASHGGNLILVARNKARLDELKTQWEKEFNVSVYTIGKDLSVYDAAREVYDEIQKQQLQVDFLINNAGYGDYGFFFETNWEKEYKMIQLNITALTQLTKLFLPKMLEQGGGKIMNLASTASFQPGPLMAVYFATKAYVLSFSQALNNELKGKNITVTALCPGLTESGFVDAAAMHTSKLAKAKRLPTSRQVAEYGYKKMLKGSSVAVYGVKNKMLITLSRFVPRKVVVNITRSLLES